MLEQSLAESEHRVESRIGGDVPCDVEPAGHIIESDRADAHEKNLLGVRLVEKTLTDKLDKSTGSAFASYGGICYFCRKYL